MKFGEKLKELRLRRGLKQGDLAELLGVSVRTVQNYENGGMHPKKRDIYYRLAEIFGVDVNYLLTESEMVIQDAERRGGSAAAKDIEALVDGICGLFSGGELPPEDLDAAMAAISEAYFSIKEDGRNRKNA